MRLSIILSLLLYMLSEDASCEGLVKSLSGRGIDEISLLKEKGLTLGGWLSGGVTYNTNSPNNHNNTPVTFNDRAGELQLNQFNIFLQKPVDLESKSWNLGGRLDFMFGTDSRFTQATGLDNKLIDPNDLRFYNIAIPQVYAELYVPLGRGITAKIGHFYTILGQEVVMSPNNFFYSHAYTMQYGEPFTHTGILFNYPISDNFSINAGAVAGWDNFRANLNNWNFLGGVSWANEEATSAVSWSIISGDIDDAGSQNRTVSSLVISRSFTEKLQYVFQHDFGYQQGLQRGGADTFWYGINQYLFYTLTDTLSAGLRAEWFRDANGIRVIKGNRAHYYELTAGLNWKPKEWLTLRPEIRYDWTDSKANTFDSFSKRNQLVFAVDLVIQF